MSGGRTAAGSTGVMVVVGSGRDVFGVQVGEDYMVVNVGVYGVRHRYGGGGGGRGGGVG